METNRNDKWQCKTQLAVAFVLTCLLPECGRDFTLSYGLAISVPLGIVSSSRFFHAVCLLAISVPLVSNPCQKGSRNPKSH